MQGWQGMLGLLEVGGPSSPGSPSFELAAQGVSREAPFVIWEWAVGRSRRLPESNTFYEGQFVSTDNGNPLTLYPVNNEIGPSWSLVVGEIMHLKLVVAQTMTGSAFYIYNEDGLQVPFWVFAADGISFDRAYKKDLLVLGVGQRQGVLVQFDKAGTYRVMQGVINDFQGDGLGIGPDYPGGVDEPMATFVVSEASERSHAFHGRQSSHVHNDEVASFVNVSALRFTPGIPSSEAVRDEEVDKQLSVTFSTLSALNRAPVPQFVIDGHAFDYRNISVRLNKGTSVEWTVISAMNYFHPMHIHVNPFQVMNVTTGFLPGTKLREAAMSTSLEPWGQWRDTALVLPFGETIIRQRLGKGVAGKTVFHCHFWTTKTKV